MVIYVQGKDSPCINQRINFLTLYKFTIMKKVPIENNRKRTKDIINKNNIFLEEISNQLFTKIDRPFLSNKNITYIIYITFRKELFLLMSSHNNFQIVVFSILRVISVKQWVIIRILTKNIFHSHLSLSYTSFPFHISKTSKSTVPPRQLLLKDTTVLFYIGGLGLMEWQKRQFQQWTPLLIRHTLSLPHPDTSWPIQLQT